LHSRGIASEADLSTPAGFKAGLMSRYGSPLGFARNYGTRSRKDIVSLLRENPLLARASDDVLNARVNEILEAGSNIGTVEYLTSVGYAENLMGAAKVEMTKEVENLLLSIDPKLDPQNPRLKTFMTQFTEAQKRNAGVHMTIDPAQGTRVATRTIDFGSIDDITEGLRKRIASGSDEILAQIKGVEDVVSESRSVFTRVASASTELMDAAPTRGARTASAALSGSSREASAAIAAGTKASKRLGATAVKALRATNAGRLFR
jgi:hypothetical protein